MATVIKAGQAGEALLRLSTVDLADHLREARDVVERAEAHARGLLDDARREAEKIRETARTQGYRDGYDAGCRAGDEEGRRKAFEEATTRFSQEHASISAAFRAAIDAIEMESDASKHAELQKAAIQAYSDAAKFYTDTIEKLKKDKSEKAQDSLMDCRLELPRILIDHAKISSVDDATRKRMLTNANALLVDFEFDYGDRPIAFEAMLEGGKCLTELGEYKQAESKLRATFALRKRLAAVGIRVATTLA